MAQVRALLDWLPDPTHSATVAVFFETANIPGRVQRGSVVRFTDEYVSMGFAKHDPPTAEQQHTT
jgi:hypothetical protein